MAIRPRGFLALQRVLFLWMRVDRQGLRHNNPSLFATTGDSCILWHQKPYINMSNRHLRTVGLVHIHIAGFILVCSATLVGVYHHRLTAGESIYTAASASLGGLAHFLCFLHTTLFNPEGFSSDFMNRSEQQVNDQLMSSVVETLSYRHVLCLVWRTSRLRHSSRYTVDYSKPQARIYHELCLDMLRFRPSAISLLLYVNTVKYGQASGDTWTEKSPTWVPDWSRLEIKQFVSLQPSSVP